MTDRPPFSVCLFDGAGQGRTARHARVLRLLTVAQVWGDSERTGGGEGHDRLANRTPTTTTTTTDTPTPSAAPSHEAAVHRRLLGRGHRRRARADGRLPLGRGRHPHHPGPHRRPRPPGGPGHDDRVGDRPRHHGHLPRERRPRWPATPTPTANRRIARPAGTRQRGPSSPCNYPSDTPTWQQLGLSVTGPDGAAVPVATYRSSARYDLEPGRAGRAVATVPGHDPGAVPGLGRQGHRGRGHPGRGRRRRPQPGADEAGRGHPRAGDGVDGGAAGRGHLPGPVPDSSVTRCPGAPPVTQPWIDRRKPPVDPARGGSCDQPSGQGWRR